MKPLKSYHQLVDDYLNSNTGDRHLIGPRTKRVVRCSACHETLTADDAARGRLVYSLHKAWHREHFKCISCHCTIEQNGTAFRECPTDKHFPMCLDCFMEENHPKCEACDRVLRETCLQAFGKLWHHSCFTCTKCHSPLFQGRYCILDGKPYDIDCCYRVRYSTVLTQQTNLFDRFLSGTSPPGDYAQSQTSLSDYDADWKESAVGSISGLSERESTSARISSRTLPQNVSEISRTL